jgi:protein ImuB
MKPRGRNTAAKSATADLFADAQPRSSLRPALRSLRSTDGVPPDVPPAPHAAARSRAQQLWYAAVFPDLLEASAAAMLQRLSLSAQQFTSSVSIEMPNALLLEIKGSVKLFGSLEVLHAGIDAVWSRLAQRAQSAMAPTTLAALWFARAGKQIRIENSHQLAGRLAGLPIACTAWDTERLQTLRSMGVTRIGELLRLPRAGLARRLSPAAVLDIDIALAKQAAPRRTFVPRERFRERCDFEMEIETVIYLQKALEPLIERCSQFLRERQAGVQTLELRLRHRAAPVTRVRLGLASITGERRRLADVLEQKLSRLALAAPVRGMELLSGSLQPLSACSLDAFAGLRNGGRDTAPQLVERLRARLGEAAVYGVCSLAEHRPEAAWQRVHELRLTAAGPRVGDMRAGAKGAERKMIDQDMPRIDQDMPRPVWLLDEPMLLSAPDVQQPPDVQQHPGELILEQGPERIESGWWDGKGVARDYYIARQIQGARWWVFQERRSKCWYLHGVFA